jgi:2-oxoisovalerate dehydrogenase E1 component
MQFADFVSTGFNPIVNLLAKSHYRWLKMLMLWFVCLVVEEQAGPFHSQTNEAWFTKTPGLKVVYPAFPYDAKGLLNAINDPNPVLFLSTNNCTTSVYQEVPKSITPTIRKAALLKETRLR